jgi:hypothetical protein
MSSPASDWDTAVGAVDAAAAAAADTDDKLSVFVSLFYADPLEFIRACYPWGQPGTELEHETGPDHLQAQFLRDLGEEVTKRGFEGRDPVMPIQMTVTSGHGSGKSVMEREGELTSQVGITEITVPRVRRSLTNPSALLRRNVPPRKPREGKQRPRSHWELG